MPLFRFRIFGEPVAVACENGETGALLAAAYGAFASPEEPSSAARGLAYTMGPGAAGGFVLRREAEEPLHAANDGMLLFHFEKDLVVELQKRRPDLYFLHAAALERDGRAVLLVAESGAGKSTTTWGLLHHGFRYASDEMAPIDLASGLVHGFPHALCLKADPPAPYPLPPGALRTPRSRHVPVELLPAGLAPVPLPLDAVVFLGYRPDRDRPAIRPMGTAEATARLYVQALNPLAHPGDGLDAAIGIVRRARCFGLETAALDATCELVVSTLFA